MLLRKLNSIFIENRKGRSLSHILCQRRRLVKYVLRILPDGLCQHLRCSAMDPSYWGTSSTDECFDPCSGAHKVRCCEEGYPLSRCGSQLPLYAEISERKGVVSGLRHQKKNAKLQNNPRLRRNGNVLLSSSMLR